MDEETKKQLLRKGDGILCPTAVFIRAGRILLGLRNYTEDKWKNISVWNNPGGRSEIGETIEETLRREVYEEIGIEDFRILNFLKEFKGAKEGDIGLLFLCEMEGDAKLMEPEKFSEWKWFDLEEVPENYISRQNLEVIKEFLRD